MNDAIRNAFNTNSGAYDIQRRKLIPCFDDFYNMAAAVLDSDKADPRVLDIGAGTGLLSTYVLKKYPAARLTLIDLSEGMMEIAQSRFQDNPNVRYIFGDYTSYEFKENYDFIVSALSIHHLSDEQKEQLFKKCYALLDDNGVFVNADQIVGNTKRLDSFYKQEWKKYIESTDLPKSEILAGYERMKLDKEATLDRQLKWLEKAGFKDVDCIYKYYNFAVMMGRKS